MKPECKTRSKKALFFFFLLVGIYHSASCFTQSWAAMAVQACFSPMGKCSNHIIRELRQAQKEILVAVFAFTSSEIAWALVQANQRGVKVRVVLDREFDKESEYSKGPFMEEKGLRVRRVSGLSKGDKRRGSMHQKFAVIDNRVVLTGSYNWTASAENYNAENLLLFHDAGPLADEYRKQFFRLWEKSR